MLKRGTAPTLVIHGEDDPLVPLAGGRDTAASIAGARLITIHGMGHDLPLALVDTLTDAIAAHAKGVAVSAQRSSSVRPASQPFASAHFGAGRSEERRVGEESVSTCRSRWSPET